MVSRHTLSDFISYPLVSIIPSADTLRPPETSASSCCLVIIFSAMIKVSFKAPGTLITHCWLYNESQGGSWLRTPSSLITDPGALRLGSSPWKNVCPSSWSQRSPEASSSLVSAGKQRAAAADPSLTRVFHMMLQAAGISFAQLSCLAVHTD